MKHNAFPSYFKIDKSVPSLWYIPMNDDFYIWYPKEKSAYLRDGESEWTTPIYHVYLAEHTDYNSQFISEFVSYL